MVYYSDEVAINAPGKNGFGDPYNRAPYPWSDASGNVNTYGPPDFETISYYSHLGAVRHLLPALRSGSVVTLFANADVYAFARVAAPENPVVVVLNKGDQDQQVAIRIRGLYPDGVLQDELAGAKFTVAGGRLRVTVPARSGLVLAGTP